MPGQLVDLALRAPRAARRNARSVRPAARSRSGCRCTPARPARRPAAFPGRANSCSSSGLAQFLGQDRPQPQRQHGVVGGVVGHAADRHLVHPLLVLAGADQLGDLDRARGRDSAWPARRGCGSARRRRAGSWRPSCRTPRRPVRRRPPRSTIMSYLRFWPIFSMRRVLQDRAQGFERRRADRGCARPPAPRTGHVPGLVLLPAQANSRRSRPSAARRASSPCRPRSASAGASCATSSARRLGRVDDVRRAARSAAAARAGRSACPGLQRRRPSRSMLRKPNSAEQFAQPRSRSNRPRGPPPSRVGQGTCAIQPHQLRGSAGPARGRRSGSRVRFAPAHLVGVLEHAVQRAVLLEQLAGRVFGPISGTPGTLSIESPTRA